MGVGDLAASQGVRLGHIGESGAYPGDLWHYARTRLVVAARAAEAAGASAARLGGFMIDAATARVFQVTLDRQAQIDAKEPR